MKATVVSWQPGEHGSRVARLKLTDGGRHGWLEVSVPAATALPHGGALEEWVMDLALTFPAGRRIELLAARSPLVWGENRMSA